MCSDIVDKDKDEWLTLLGTSDGWPMVLRRHESAKHLTGKPGLSVCIQVGVSFTPSDSSGLANVEGPLLDWAEFVLRAVARTQSEACHVLTVTTNGRREWMFYGARQWIEGEIQTALSSRINVDRISVRSERDDNWSFFKVYE